MSFLLGIAGLVLHIASIALLVYCVMSFIMPHNELYRKAAYYVEPVLHPIRLQLYRWFPSLRDLPVDFSPLALWLALDIAGGLINVLRGIF